MIAAIEPQSAPAAFPARGAAVTIGQAIAAVLKAKALANCRPQYLTSLRQYLAQFARGREDTPIASFTIETVEQWFAGRNEAPSSVVSNAGRLAALFSFAVRRQWIPRNPIDLMEPVRIDRKPPAILTPLQAALIMDWARRRKPHQLAFFTLAMLGGIRPDELARLTWDCVRFEGDSAVVTIDAAASKVRRRRLVELEPVAVKWLAMAKEAGARLPVPRITRNRFLGQARRVLDFPEWPQDCLRHTAASYLLALRRDPGKVAFTLGNSSAILLRHYMGLVSAADCAAFWGFTPDSPRPMKPTPEVVRPEFIPAPVPDASAIVIDPTATRFARAEQALKLEPEFRRLARERQRVAAYHGGVTGKRLGGERIDTIGRLGDLAGCSRQTLQYVRIIVQHADHDVIDRLRRGKLSISGVYKQLQPSHSAPSSAV